MRSFHMSGYLLRDLHKVDPGLVSRDQRILLLAAFCLDILWMSVLLQGNWLHNHDGSSCVPGNQWNTRFPSVAITIKCTCSFEYNEWPMWLHSGQQPGKFCPTWPTYWAPGPTKRIQMITWRRPATRSTAFWMRTLRWAKKCLTPHWWTRWATSAVMGEGCYCCQCHCVWSFM